MVTVSGNSRRPPSGGGPTLLLTIIFSWIGEIASHVSNLQLLTTLRAGISRLFGTGAATESVNDVPIASGHPTEEVERVQADNGKKLNTSDGAYSLGKDCLVGHDSITRPGEEEQGWECKKAGMTVSIEGLYCHDAHALSDQHESTTFVPIEENRTKGSDEMVLPVPKSRSFTHLCHFVSAVPCNEGPMSSPKVTPKADPSAVADVKPSQAATMPAADAVAKRIGKEASSLPVWKNSGPKSHPSSSPLPTKEGPAHPSSSPPPTEGSTPHPPNTPLNTGRDPSHASSGPVDTEEMTTGKDVKSKHQPLKEMKTNLTPLAHPSDSAYDTAGTPLNVP